MKFNKPSKKILDQAYALAKTAARPDRNGSRYALYKLRIMTEEHTPLGHGWTHLSGCFIGLASFLSKAERSQLPFAVRTAKEFLPLIAKKSSLSRRTGLEILFRAINDPTFTAEPKAPLLVIAERHVRTQKEEAHVNIAFDHFLKGKIIHFDSLKKMRALQKGTAQPVKKGGSAITRLCVLGILDQVHKLPITRHQIPNKKQADAFVHALAKLEPKEGVRDTQTLLNSAPRHGALGQGQLFPKALHRPAP
ncbi:MAG TPA: hypothetical protein DD400_04495 [Rhodospirillaceae bacterium]|nr:hypothetical protein [Rhodospirillaceae bacterium]